MQSNISPQTFVRQISESFFTFLVLKMGTKARQRLWQLTSRCQSSFSLAFTWIPLMDEVKTLSSRPLPGALENGLCCGPLFNLSSHYFPALMYLMGLCFRRRPSRVFSEVAPETKLLSGHLPISWARGEIDPAVWKVTPSAKRTGEAAKCGIFKNKFLKNIDGSVFQLSCINIMGSA